MHEIIENIKSLFMNCKPIKVDIAIDTPVSQIESIWGSAVELFPHSPIWTVKVEAYSQAHIQVDAMVHPALTPFLKSWQLESLVPTVNIAKFEFNFHGNSLQNLVDEIYRQAFDQQVDTTLTRV